MHKQHAGTLSLNSYCTFIVSSFKITNKTYSNDQIQQLFFLFRKNFKLKDNHILLNI